MSGRDASDNKYLSLQRRLRRERTLFEDKDFPPLDKTLFTRTRPSVNLVWKRPWEICRNPEFFTSGVSRSDVAQGRIRNCWFVAAVAALTDAKKLFYHVVPSEQGFDEGLYCGMFRFNFWRFGEWVEVIIDDFLPTYNGKLYYAHSSDAREFWSSLLEKAYAKVCGSYEAMGFGRISEALQDFTGGVIEVIDMKNAAPPNLFAIMQKAHDRQSLMGCSLESTKGEQRLANGLISSHAYSVSGLAKVRLRSVRGIPEEELVRVRNPHGDSSEWRGAWSDRSDEWNTLSERERKRLQLTFEDDGEFWMSFKDFLSNFTRLEICMLSPDSVLDATKRSWKNRRETGSWQKGITAGGCRNFIDTFHINPQFRIQLEDPDDDDDEDNCSIVVSLTRIDRRRIPTDERPPIGFAIYKVPESLSYSKRCDKQFFERNKAIAMTTSFTKLREICCRFSLLPGEYLIIPSTFKPGQEAKFLLRIFSEKPHDTSEIDQDTEVTNPPQVVVSSTDAKQIDEKYWSIFHRYAGEDREVDQLELQLILTYSFKNELNANTFSLEACRSMISMFDKDKSGALGYTEFRELRILIEKWKDKFHEFDRDRSGDMNMYELRDALQGLGYQLSNDALRAVVLRYHNKKGTISFDTFIQIVVRVIVMFDTFRKQVEKRGGRRERAVFNIDEFIECTLTV